MRPVDLAATFLTAVALAASGMPAHAQASAPARSPSRSV